MCFYIKGRQKVAKVAATDLTVFKLLKKHTDGRLMSPLNECYWSPGITHKADLQRTREYGQIHVGLHAKKTVLGAKNFSSIGLVVECVVPKGSLYWENDDEIVAERMYMKDGKDLRKPPRKRTAVKGRTKAKNVPIKRLVKRGK